MTILYVVVGLVAAQRGVELVLAATNTRRLRAQGAVEIDAAGYPWLVALHAAWLAAIALLVPARVRPYWVWLVLFGLLQAGRLWAIGTLGRRWTTRILVLPQAPLIRRGPYRLLRHPNYVIVMAEIVVLPLAFGAVALAAIFAAANLVLLARRIAIEDRFGSFNERSGELSRARRRHATVHQAVPAAASAAAVVVAGQPRSAAAAGAAERARNRPQRA